MFKRHSPSWIRCCDAAVTNCTRRRSAMPSQSTTGTGIPIPGPARSSVGLFIVSRSSLLYLGPGQEVMQTRDEIFGELVKRFGKDRVTRGTRFDHYGRSS